MKRSWFSILTVFALLGLLVLLAVLQYRWVGQISDADRDRMQKRLQSDTDRFAEDFNEEIRKAYFNFQSNAGIWKEKDWRPFNEQYDFWKKNSAYPDLVAGFYFIQTAQTAEQPLTYDPSAREFTEANLPDDVARLADALKKEEGFEPVAENIPALIIPVYEDLEKIADKMVHKIGGEAGEKIRMPMEQPRKKYGFFIIRLDKSVLEKQILPALANQYFSADDNANYRLSVVSRNDPSQIIFNNHSGETLTATDSSASLFSLSPEKMAFFFKPDVIDSLKRKAGPGGEKERGNVVINQRYETKSSVTATSASDPGKPREHTFNFQVSGDEKPRITVMEGKDLNPEGVWLLNVQHRAGSLEQFITNTRNKNLAVSFGILALLGISVVMIFFSAQRAKKLAQRQLDFVSSVSHEFRTPLAVIYSAGENLTDGVVNSDAQVAEYGTLIKHEGKKLSGMVEQILEFAGARSGRQKYDFRQVNVEDILSEALNECQPLIDSTGFNVETNLPETLPSITADGKSLSHAFQNLINNAIKYSTEIKYLKITAENGGGTIKLSFEDRGRGISARDRSQIFEPFYRGKEVVEAQIHGNGLGLSLVKQIVEAHNGKISVESRHGEGSKFTIQVPIQQ